MTFRNLTLTKTEADILDWALSAMNDNYEADQPDFALNGDGYEQDEIPLLHQTKRGGTLFIGSPHALVDLIYRIGTQYIDMTEQDPEANRRHIPIARKLEARLIEAHLAFTSDTPPEDEPEPGFAQDEQPNGDAVHDSILALLNDDDDLWNTAQEALVQSAARVPDDELHGASGDLDREEYEAAEKEREWDNRIAAAEEAEIAEYLTHEQMFGTPPDPAITEPEWEVRDDGWIVRAKPLKPEGEQPNVGSAASMLMALLRVSLPADVQRWVDTDHKGNPSRIQICETETTGTILERVEAALPIVPRFLITPDVQMGDGDQGAFIDLPAYLDWLLSPDRDPRRLVDNRNGDKNDAVTLRDSGNLAYDGDFQRIEVNRLERKDKDDKPRKRTYQTRRMSDATFARFQRLLDYYWPVSIGRGQSIYRSVPTWIKR